MVPRHLTRLCLPPACTIWIELLLCCPRSYKVKTCTIFTSFFVTEFFSVLGQSATLSEFEVDVLPRLFGVFGILGIVVYAVRRWWRPLKRVICSVSETTESRRAFNVTYTRRANPPPLKKVALLKSGAVPTTSAMPVWDAARQLEWAIYGRADCKETTRKNWRAPLLTASSSKPASLHYHH